MKSGLRPSPRLREMPMKYGPPMKMVDSFFCVLYIYKTLKLKMAFQNGYAGLSRLFII